MHLLEVGEGDGWEESTYRKREEEKEAEGKGGDARAVYVVKNDDLNKATVSL